MDPYYEYILSRLKNYSDITRAIIQNNIREKFSDFSASYRSVRLYVCNIREKEGIPVPVKIRQYGYNQDLPFRFQAQVDMGQKTIKDINGKVVKVYIFAMVIISSRYKFVCFQLEPFNPKFPKIYILYQQQPLKLCVVVYQLRTVQHFYHRKFCIFESANILMHLKEVYCQEAVYPNSYILPPREN